MADYSVDNNDAFAAFVKKSEADEAARAAKQSNSSGSNFTYETQTWVGLVTNVPHIIRLVGNPPESMTPNFKAGPFDAHEIYFEQVKDDNGDRMQLRLPCHAEDINDEHIMWRIINKVKEVDWVDDPEKKGKRKRVYKYEKTPIFDKVVHSGFNSADPREADSYRYAKGWGGQQVVIMNVIDREDDWCKTNKHTKLLSKKVSERNGTLYPTVGVPSYGFLSELKNLVKIYGPWTNYDIQITKTGQMNNPYIIKNASYYKSAGVPEIDQSKLPFISVEPKLTDEEMSYEMYDIAKFYKPTSYKNLRDRLGRTIKEIDATLGTHFYPELDALAKKEEEELAASRESQKAEEPVASVASDVNVSDDILDPYSAPIQNSVKVAESTIVSTAPAESTTQAKVAPTRSTRNISTLAPEKIAALKGWLKLSSAQQAQIKDVILTPTGEVETVIYTDDADTQCNCNNCMKPSPSSFLTCPVCGLDFE